MINKVIMKRSVAVVFIAATFTDTGIAYAFDMCDNIFNMINKSKMKQSEMNQSGWRSDSRYRDDYYGETGPDSVYSYRDRGYGQGSTGYGYVDHPAYGYGYIEPAYAVPQPGNDALQEEIYQLKMRIKYLEKALSHESSLPQKAPTNPGAG